MASVDALTAPVEVVAPRLLGATLTHAGVRLRVTEVEAYSGAGEDAASHAHRGPTPRTVPMFGPVGHAYVYRSYGVHWCLNLVCGDAPGSAVLIRALQPLHGLELMRRRRALDDPRRLCSGPGRLCQALDVTAALDGHPLDAPPFRLMASAAASPVAAGPRIGISKGTGTPWRFVLPGSRFLSRPG